MRHKCPLGSFKAPEARSAHVHLDLVAHLPYSNGYHNLLSCVERCTGLPGTVPYKNITAETMTSALAERWEETSPVLQLSV